MDNVLMRLTEAEREVIGRPRLDTAEGFAVTI